MNSKSDQESNVQQAVPFLAVTDMKRSLQFYVDGLGFQIEEAWKPEGGIRWCSIRHGRAELMLQEDDRERKVVRGLGVTVYFICQDALDLYDRFVAGGICPREPFVGNRMWVVEVIDPDGYRLAFESPTDVPEETRLSKW